MKSLASSPPLGFLERGHTRIAPLLVCCVTDKAVNSWQHISNEDARLIPDDPATKAKSVMLTEEGAKRSRRLFEKHFMTE
jgi:hypothetical protein